ncbi:MAG: CRTAC1 family protein, partial [Acidobacteria bacterium]|nr:CRTAC1 family protein [Acidobacteriota bacterium]
AQVSRPYVGWGTGFFDLDNDGWLDLLVVNGHVYPQIDTLPSGARYRQPKLLHMNQANGTFCDASAQAGAALLSPRVSRGAAFGDLDNDGQVDVVVNDLDGPPMILRNEGGDGNHWVTLELGTARGNRLAIGARVKIVTADMAQIEEVRSGGSYLSQNDLRIHFGTGKYRNIDVVEIRWPSGKTEVIKGLSTDKLYSILGGEGVVPTERLKPISKVKK